MKTKKTLPKALESYMKEKAFDEVKHIEGDIYAVGYSKYRMNQLVEVTDEKVVMITADGNYTFNDFLLHSFKDTLKAYKESKIEVKTEPVSEDNSSASQNTDDKE